MYRMVDHKHRYGSNLRRYHAEWKKAQTNENFFFWLDYGEGKDLDLEDRPRSRLDTECVRYLSREERQKYLVKIDKDGLFRYAKNDNLVTTSPDFRDSIAGIVPVDDKTPTWREVTTGESSLHAVNSASALFVMRMAHELRIHSESCHIVQCHTDRRILIDLVSAKEPEPHSSDTDSLSGISTGSHEDSSKYANTELHDANGIEKVRHLNVDTVMNHMLRKTTKKNTWIFVADTSFRLYIGIKQSGAFQHSSFLRGARVSAAGLSKSITTIQTCSGSFLKVTYRAIRSRANAIIFHGTVKVKRGQLRKLSPLSGHYAPVSRFSPKERQREPVDMLWHGFSFFYC